SPRRSAELGWAAVLHEIGKPIVWRRSGEKNVNAHEVEGGRMAAEIGARLRLPRGQTDRIVALIEDHLKFREVFQMREATLQRFIRQEHFDELLVLHKADAIATDGNLAFHEFCAGRRAALRDSPAGVEKLIDGKDLIQLGFAPGPGFADIL